MNIKSIFKQDVALRRKMVLEGNISKTLLFLSLPTLITVIVQSLSPIIDGLFIYNFSGAISGAAISYSSSLINVFIMGSTGIGAAGAAIIGQVNGQGDLREGRRLSSQFVVLSFLVGVIAAPIMVFVGMVANSGLEEVLRKEVFIYVSLNALTLPMILIQTAYVIIRNSGGKPEGPLVRALLMIPLKGLSSFLFVVILHLGIVGAALATFFAYILMLGFMLFDLFIKKSPDILFLSDGLRPDINFLKRLLRIGMPAIISGTIKSFGFFVMKIETSKFGSIALNASGISGDVQNTFFALSCFFDASINTMVSMNCGAGNSERARKAATKGVLYGFMLSFLLTAICITISPFIISLYTSDLSIQKLSYQALVIGSLSISGFSLIFNMMPAFQALGENTSALFIQVIRIWVLRTAFFYVVSFYFPSLGVYTVFWSFFFCNMAGAGVSWYFFSRLDWTRKLV